MIRTQSLHENEQRNNWKRTEARGYKTNLEVGHGCSKRDCFLVRNRSNKQYENRYSHLLEELTRVQPFLEARNRVEPRTSRTKADFFQSRPTISFAARGNLRRSTTSCLASKKRLAHR